ncbi:MAG: hypothetical protein DRQ48_03860 [Gammaproteobacteria bacterium]|nr:MAG: hypothetical protein DRQ48_03860 [Gammaproteobacteria bacterium]
MSYIDFDNDSKEDINKKLSGDLSTSELKMLAEDAGITSEAQKAIDSAIKEMYRAVIKALKKI